MTKTKTLFSLETSVHVHFHCVAFLSRSALPSGRESWPGQYLLRLRHEIVRGCQVVPQILPKASRGLMVGMCQRFLRAWRTVLEGGLRCSQMTLEGRQADHAHSPDEKN